MRNERCSRVARDESRSQNCSYARQSVEFRRIFPRSGERSSNDLEFQNGHDAFLASAWQWACWSQGNHLCPTPSCAAPAGCTARHAPTAAPSASSAQSPHPPACPEKPPRGPKNAAVGFPPPQLATILRRTASFRGPAGATTPEAEPAAPPTACFRRMRPYPSHDGHPLTRQRRPDRHRVCRTICRTDSVMDQARI